MLRIISQRTHTIIGLVVGAALLLAPTLFQFTDNSTASMAAMIVGGFIILNELITTSPLSPLKLIPMKVHLMIDIVAGAFLALSPWILGFMHSDHNNQWVPHLIVGIAIIGYALMTRTSDDEQKSVI